MTSPERLRVGIVEYLNAWPLAWSFLEGRYDDRFETLFLRPSAVADRMADGSLDVGLLPSAELARIPGLEVLPGLCVASEHEVNSVLLVSKVPPEQIARLALDASSRTSVILVQILLAERGVRPEVVVREPRVEDMLDGADAALVIGDAALRIDRDRYLVTDLAAEWRRLTGLPFVFAVWAMGPAAAGRPEVAFYFHQSLRHGLAAIPDVVRRAVRELGLGKREAQTYLTRNLKYSLGGAERESLEEFVRRGVELGLLPATPEPIRFAEAAGELVRG